MKERTRRNAAQSRETLLAAATEEFASHGLAGARIDRIDLEGYAGRTYDLLVERPRLWRLLTWHHLERGQDVLMLPAGEVLLGEKLDGIAAAQAEGRIVADFTPMDVVRLVAALTQLWCMTGAARDATEHAARRATIMRAVGRLLRV